MKTLPVLLCFFYCINLAVAQETKIPIPPASDILARLNHEHPRLLATKADFDHLRTEIKTNKMLGRWYRRIYLQAEMTLDEAPSTYEIPDGLRLLATSQKVLRRVYDLGLVWQITGDKRFADRAWAELDAAGHFKDWNNRHFLDTAEMTHAFGIGYDWFYDYLTPLQRSFLRKAMVEKGLMPGLIIQRKKSYWSVFTFNWNQVCNGGLTMGALAIADEEPALCGEFLHDAMQSIQLAMASFAPDGGWNEGPGYWGYATSYNVTMLAGLQSALGTDYGLSRMPGFSDAGLFPIYMTSPCRHEFNFADAHDAYGELPQLFWLARQFDRPEFAAAAQKEAKGSVESLLWYTPSDPNSITRLPLDKYFRQAEVVALRGSWTDTNATYVAFKAGRNGVNHGHLDLGSFVLDADGERWALDLGADNYNLPGYFNFAKKRWDYYRLRAEGHNTLVFGPNVTGGPDQVTTADTRIVRFESTPARAFGITDLSPAYTNTARSVERGIALMGRTKVLVEDEVQADKPVQLWWFMHTAAAIQLKGPSAMLALGDKQLYARILSPPGAVFTKMTATPLPTSPHPPKQGANDNVSKLTIKMDSVKKVRLAVWFTPAEESNEAPPKVIPLRNW